MSWKLGLVGCGMMGARYAKVFGNMPDTDIVACADPTPEKLDEFQRNTAIREGFTDFGKMLESVDLDGVLNVTYDPLHITVLEAALEHGIPVLTEKPLGTSLEECRRLYRFPEETLKAVTVNFSKRNAGAVLGARELAAAGTLGTILSVEASYRQGWVVTKEWGDWRKKNAWLWRLDSDWSPLGVFTDLGSHLLDLIMFITGEEFEYLCCTGTLLADKGVTVLKGHRLDSPDRLTAAGRLVSGAAVDIVTSRIDPDETDRPALTIRGDKGALRIDLMDRRHSVELHMDDAGNLPSCFGSIESPAAGVWTELPVPKPRNVYEEFAAGLSGNDTGRPGLMDAMKVQATLEAVRISGSESGRPVNLSELGP